MVSIYFDRAYLFLPVIAGFYQANTIRVQAFCLLFWFLGTSVVSLVYTLTGKEYVGINWTFLSLYAGYMAAGALLYWHLPVTRPRAWLAGAIWACCSIAIMVLTWWRCDRLGHADEAFYVYSSPLVLIAALAAFVFLRAGFSRTVRPQGRWHAFLTFFGKVSFGVYLLHVWAIFFFAGLGYNYQFVNPWLAIPVLALFTVLSCAAVVHLMQKIPLLRLIVPS